MLFMCAVCGIFRELMRELKMSSGAISKLVAKDRLQAQALLGR